MKSLKIILGLFILIISTASATYAQQQFTHTVTTQNRYCNSACTLMDNPGLNNNGLAIILVTQVAVNGMNRNPHPVGVYFVNEKTWSIINTDGAAIPVGAKFNVEYYANPTPDQFIYVIPAKGGIAYIDHPGLNANPNARVRFLPTHSPRGAYFNADEVKIEYDPSALKWIIANINNQPMRTQTAYNIVITSGGTAETPSIIRPLPNPNSPPQGPPARNPVGEIIGSPPYNPTLIPPVVTATPPATSPPVPISTTVPPNKTRSRNWSLRLETEPSIPPNSDILLFIHGMDSRAEESDDITKALFALKASGFQPTQPTPAVPPSNTVLQQLLRKYKPCILERYETQQDMTNRGLAGNLSGLLDTNGLFDRDTVACVAGNNCSRSSRLANFARLQAQANQGDPSNFQTLLEQSIPKDCFDCQKHREMHTKHVHCTMEAGGNSGLKGPYFEGCKAGVDMQALANIVIGDIRRLIGAAPAMQMTGGPSIATNYSMVNFTSCSDPAGGCPDLNPPCGAPDDFSMGQRRGVLPSTPTGAPLYFAPSIPLPMLDTPPPSNQQMNVPAARHLGQNEGRLRPELRKAALDAKPLQSLRLAAYQFADGDTDLGNAFADLSVTGARTFAAFRTALPKDPFCQSVVSQRPPQLQESSVLNGCYAALDRAYRVANYLRTGQRGDTSAEKTRKMAERSELGWIAVSGEDDSPHRPVNVPSSDYPQYDIDVVVEAPLATGPKTVTVRTRYVIAQSQAAGKNLVMISLDLPTSGYSENLDFERVSPLGAIGNPKWTPLPVPIAVPFEITFLIPGMPPILPPGFVIPPGTPLPDFHATGKTPVLDFLENFIVRFAEALDQKVPVKNNFKAVMGGSLGGNMTFRLGRRPNVPWLPKFIVWSPASIWTSLGEGADIFKHLGPRTAWESANAARNTPRESDRAAFFAGWDKPIVPMLIPMAQSDSWTSDYYPCKKSTVAAARLDRQETYDPRFLSWRWRLGAEQLLYSHQTIDTATNRPRYMSNLKPMLLACGTEDRVKFNDICPATQSTAPLMTLTPGKAIFLDKTGHSLDNERRAFWAAEIVQFLGL